MEEEGRIRGRRFGEIDGDDDAAPFGGGVVGESGQVGFMCSSGERPLNKARNREDWASK